MQYTYQTQGVCSQEMHFTIEDGILTDLDVIDGCSGSLAGIARLVEGMPVEQVIERLSGVRCGEKATSCPDQLAQALQAAIAQGEQG